ncbi:MAG: hypothetical protein MI861_26215 [Pirellulales bacterium]|nr:hypothetical protein [Pirellulales bacterium]
MFLLDVLSRVIHVGTAITLVGGSLFTLMVLIPSANELDDDAHHQLAQSVGGRWKRWVHLGVLLFLISGFYNYIRAVPRHDGDSLYHILLGTKMLLAMGVFFLASALAGKSPMLQPIRDQRAKWLKVLLLIAATIVCISGFVKVRGIPQPASVESSQSQ